MENITALRGATKRPRVSFKETIKSKSRIYNHENPNIYIRQYRFLRLECYEIKYPRLVSRAQRVYHITFRI